VWSRFLSTPFRLPESKNWPKPRVYLASCRKMQLNRAVSYRLTECAFCCCFFLHSGQFVFNCVVSSSCFLCSDCFVCYCQYQCKWLTGTTQLCWCGCAHSCTRSLVCLCASERWQIFDSTTYIQYHIQARATKFSSFIHLWYEKDFRVWSGSSKVC